MKLKYDHKKAVKPSDVDEKLSQYVFRPLGSLIVKALLNTFVSPNHVTYFGVFLGMSSGVTFYFGVHPAISAFLLYCALLLDIVDGQLARARGGGSPKGRLLDGIADYIVLITLYVTVVFRFLSKYPDSHVLLIAIAAGICHIVHSYLFDMDKNKYNLNIGRGFIDGVVSFSEGKEHLKGAISRKSFIDIIFNIFLVGYLFGIEAAEKITSKMNGQKKSVFIEDRAGIYKLNYRKVVVMWTYMGPVTHVFYFVIGFLFHVIEPQSIIYVFWFIIIPSNIYVIIINIVKHYAAKRFKKMIST